MRDRGSIAGDPELFHGACGEEEGKLLEEVVDVLMADDGRLRQARRPEISGAADVGRVFTYYAEYPPVRIEPAWLEGREILLVSAEPPDGPSYFMLLEWREQKISLIRDHRYATYVIEGADVMPAA